MQQPLQQQQWLMMPFGKYKGRPIKDIISENAQYLRWAIDTVDMDRWPGLFVQIREALRREGELND